MCMEDFIHVLMNTNTAENKLEVQNSISGKINVARMSEGAVL